MDKLFEEITIDKEKVRLGHEDVAIDLVDLDQDNPRVKYRMAFSGGKKPIEEMLLENTEVRSLKKDIKLTGGLRERVILQKKGKRYKAIEGNCRKACYSSLHKEDEQDVRWQTIPARILPANVSARKIAILLSGMHVAGKIAWDAHEKAGQVYRMSNELDMDQGDIATIMRQSKTTVGRFLHAYTFMMDRFLKVDNGKYAKQGERKWSFFDELYRSKSLRERLKKEPQFGDDFCRWVGEGRLAHGIEVRKLNEILSYPDARERFESAEKDKAFGAAIDLVKKAEPEHDSEFFKLLAKVRDNCTSAAQVKEILRIRTDKTAQQRVLETYDALVDFMRLADLSPSDSG